MWGDKECQASEAYWKAQAKFENLERMKNKGWGEKPPKIEENKMKNDITDLIERLDQRYGNPNAKDCALIQEAIKALRSQQEEIHALLGDVMEMAKGQDK